MRTKRPSGDEPRGNGWEGWSRAWTRHQHPPQPESLIGLKSEKWLYKPLLVGLTAHPSLSLPLRKYKEPSVSVKNCIAMSSRVSQTTNNMWTGPECKPYLGVLLVLVVS